MIKTMVCERPQKRLESKTKQLLSVEAGPLRNAPPQLAFLYTKERHDNQKKNAKNAQKASMYLRFCWNPTHNRKTERGGVTSLCSLCNFQRSQLNFEEETVLSNYLSLFIRPWRGSLQQSSITMMLASRWVTRRMRRTMMQLRA